MRFMHSLTLATAGMGFFAGTGCVSGMRYKIPMPESLTIGTIQNEPPTQTGRKVTRTGRKASVVSALPAAEVESRFVATAD